jgi:hypothetical protein
LRILFFRGADINGAALEGVRVFRIDLTGMKELEHVSAKWVDLGPEGSPIRLGGGQLHDWLICAVMMGSTLANGLTTQGVSGSRARQLYADAEKSFSIHFFYPIIESHLITLNNKIFQDKNTYRGTRLF